MLVPRCAQTESASAPVFAPLSSSSGRARRSRHGLLPLPPETDSQPRSFLTDQRISLLRFATAASLAPSPFLRSVQRPPVLSSQALLRRPRELSTSVRLAPLKSRAGLFLFPFASLRSFMSLRSAASSNLFSCPPLSARRTDYFEPPSLAQASGDFSVRSASSCALADSV